jgi:hypothetical protein
MTSRRFSVELEWVNTAPSTARHLIGASLDGFGCVPEAREQAVLVVSELVSTAVNEHVGTPILDGELWHGTLNLWVSNGPLLDGPSGADDYSDLRARVLSATCDDWGVDSGVAGSRQWASLDLDDRLRHAS